MTEPHGAGHKLKSQRWQLCITFSSSSLDEDVGRPWIGQSKLLSHGLWLNGIAWEACELAFFFLGVLWSLVAVWLICRVWGGMVGLGGCVIWGRWGWVWFASLGQGDDFWCIVVFVIFGIWNTLYLVAFWCGELCALRCSYGEASWVAASCSYVPGLSKENKYAFFFLRGCGVLGNLIHVFKI